MNSFTRRHSRIAGFTLIEVMITVAVIAILAAVALPNYIDYVTRSKLVEAKTNLSDMRTRLEQYFLDNRAYPTTCATYAAGAPPANTIYKPASIKNFAIDCPTLTATTYTVRAQGEGFTFTVNQANVRATTVVPTGWTTSATCWVSRKNGDC
ncbi:MAG: type IV pilin protein [Betaproteobacteria bacterium]